MTPPRLRVSVTDATGRPVASHGLAKWLRRAAPASARGAVAIALVTDAAMRRLNHDYRGKNHASDVLSFPCEPPLGDIAISIPTARRQAREMGHSLRVELRVLALHGLLHLMGYDHETDRGQMQRAEEKLRRRSGLPAGLVGRDSRSTRR